MIETRKLPDYPNAISANMINVELKKTGTTKFDINASDNRKLAGKLSGAISFHDFHGKSGETIYYTGSLRAGSWGFADFGYKKGEAGTLTPTKAPDGKEITGFWSNGMGEVSIITVAGYTSSTPPWGSKVKMVGETWRGTIQTETLTWQYTGDFGWCYYGGDDMEWQINGVYDVWIKGV